ncbi:unnamed protein product, partial [marine sediment metagenome]
AETLAGMRRAAHLVREGLEEEPVPVLSPDRREALLRAVSEPKKTKPGRRFLIGTGERTSFLHGLAAAAACVVLLALAAGMFLPALSRAREESRVASARNMAKNRELMRILVRDKAEESGPSGIGGDEAFEFQDAEPSGFDLASSGPDAKAPE